MLSRGVGGSRLAGPCGGGSPSSGEASTPVGAAGRAGLAGRPFSTKAPQWCLSFLRHGVRAEGPDTQCLANTTWLLCTSTGDGQMERPLRTWPWTAGPTDWWRRWMFCSMPPHLFSYGDAPALPTLNQGFQEEGILHLDKRRQVQRGSDCQDTTQVNRRAGI